MWCPSPSRPFIAAEHLRNEAEVAAYIEAMLEDGDARAVPVALRTIVDAVGGMTALADKTGSPARRCIGPFPTPRTCVIVDKTRGCISIETTDL